MKRLQGLWLGTTLFLSPALHAVSMPGPATSTGTWTITATILNLSATNSSGVANPSGTLYFFGVSINSQATIANQNLVSDGAGNQVVSNVASAYAPTGSPSASDTINGQVTPLLANTTYYTYAQACPASIDPQNPRQPNDPTCSAWQRLSTAPQVTTHFQDPGFSGIAPGDVAGNTSTGFGVVVPSVTVHANPTADNQNIVYWHVQLVDLLLGTTAPTLNLIGSDQIQKIFYPYSPSTSPNATPALLANRPFLLKEWFEYPYGQTSSTATVKFYTSPEPANLYPLISSPPSTQRVLPQNVVAVTSYSVTVQYLNAVDPRLPNPANAVLRTQLYVATDYIDTVKTYQSTTPIVGVSTEVVTVTTPGLLPGTTYNVYTQMIYSGRSYPDATWPYTQQFMGTLTTLGNPPAPFSDPNFQQIYPNAVSSLNFRATSNLTPAQTNLAAWHLSIHDRNNLTTSPEIVIPASDFILYQGSYSVNVSTADWSGLLPGNKFDVSEWMEYNDGTPMTSSVTVPYIYLKPEPPGIPSTPIVGATDHGFTVQIQNSDQPDFPNPSRGGSTKYYFSVQQNGRTVASGKTPSLTGVSTETISYNATGLTPNTNYSVYVTLSLDNAPWPGLGNILVSTSAMTLPQDRVISIDPATVTESSAVATLTDVQDSTVGVHYSLNWSVASTQGPWSKLSFSTAPITGLTPNQTYQVQGQVCTSADNSACNALQSSLFTSQPASVSVGTITAHSNDLTASWQDANPAGTAYNVRYCLVDTTFTCTAVQGSTKTLAGMTMSMMATGLIEGDTYQAQVQAINRGGAPWPDAGWSVVGTIRTPPSSLLTVLSAAFTLNGFPLDNTTVCLPPAAQLVFTFNRDIDTNTIPSSLVVQHRAFQFNGNPQLLSAASWIYSSGGGHYVLTVSPPLGGWPVDDPLSVTLKTTLQDNYPTHLSSDYSVSFVTAGDPTRVHTLSSFVDGQAQGSAQFGANALDPNTCAVLRTRFLAPTNGLAADANGAMSATLLQGDRASAEEIVTVQNSLRTNVTFASPVTLFLPFPPNTNVSFGGSNQAVAEDWTIARVNPQTSRLEAVTSSVQMPTGVQATITESGVYMLAQAYSSTDIGGAYAYPVPYRSDMPIQGITFANLGADSQISIYTPSGLKIKTIPVPLGQDKILWNLHQDHVASGVYLYRVESPSGKKFGKLIIVQ